MNTSASQREPTVCDTSPIRYFALVGRFDLLVGVLGAPVLVPREVLDLEEDPDGIESLVSEISRSERYWSQRAIPEAMDNWSRLRALRQRDDIENVDLDEGELQACATLGSAEFGRSVGLVAPLGRGEAAVISIAEARGWGAVLDEHAARQILSERNPASPIRTSRDILRQAVITFELLDSDEAKIVYADMLAKGYRGPPELWGG